MTLDADRRATLRSARLALTAASRMGNAGAVEFALVAYVGALYATSFSTLTIHVLVEAALDAGLPPERRTADYELRVQAIARWLARADRLLDELPPTIPRRPDRFLDEATLGDPGGTDGSGVRHHSHSPSA